MEMISFTLRDDFNCWDHFFPPFVMCCPPSQLMYLYYIVCNTCTRLSYPTFVQINGVCKPTARFFFNEKKQALLNVDDWFVTLVFFIQSTRFECSSRRPLIYASF
jgi:hypothetical protein